MGGGEGVERASSRSLWISFPSGAMSARLPWLCPPDATHRRESQLAAMREVSQQAAKLPAKVQILWGEQDPTFRSKLLPYLLRDSLPHCAEPVFVPQVSHLLPEDAPELLAEKVLHDRPQTRPRTDVQDTLRSLVAAISAPSSSGSTRSTRAVKPPRATRPRTCRPGESCELRVTRLPASSNTRA